jgi:hypothetical protein
MSKFMLQSRFAALFAHIMSKTGLQVQRPRSYGDLRYRVRRVPSTLELRSEAEHQRLLDAAVTKREVRAARNIRNEAAQGRG